MFKRFIRALKSMFGGVISSMEDPKLILEQNIRDLNDQIPQMNENIATVKANLLMLQKESNRNEKLIVELTSKIKSAIQANRDDIAEGYALQLEKAKENFAHTKDQLVFAEKAYDKALKVKKVFMREKDRKIQEAKEALRASERAEWQSKIADTLEQFEVGGMDQTHDEMINRLNERTAKNEARMEIALDGIDTETMEIEANAEKIRAQSLVEQFKMEMGETSGSINIDEAPVAEEKAPKKSVGNKEKKLTGFIMSSKSEQERERLKQEYKEHYRRIKELKEQGKRAEQKGKIAQAVNNMNADNILESVDEFLGKVRDKVTHVEAKLDVAMDSMGEDSDLEQQAKNEEHEEELKKQKAKQTLQQVKAEMGMLYSEIEKTADEIKTEKTIGTKKNTDSSDSTNEDTDKA